MVARVITQSDMSVCPFVINCLYPVLKFRKTNKSLKVKIMINFIYCNNVYSVSLMIPSNYSILPF